MKRPPSFSGSPPAPHGPHFSKTKCKTVRIKEVLLVFLDSFPPASRGDAAAPGRPR